MKFLRSLGVIFLFVEKQFMHKTGDENRCDEYIVT